MKKIVFLICMLGVAHISYAADLCGSSYEDCTNSGSCSDNKESCIGSPVEPGLGRVSDKKSCVARACLPSGANIKGFGGGRDAIVSENKDTVLPCPKPAVGVAAPTAVSPAPTSPLLDRARAIGAVFTSRVAAPAARSSAASVMATPGIAAPVASGGVFGPRDACRQRSADEQRQIDQGNQTVINRIFCPSATPQCCASPLPGAGEPMRLSDCYVRGTVCPRPKPRDPNPKKDPPKKDCRMEGGVMVCTIPGL